MSSHRPGNTRNPLDFPLPGWWTPACLISLALEVVGLVGGWWWLVFPAALLIIPAVITYLTRCRAAYLSRKAPSDRDGRPRVDLDSARRWLAVFDHVERFGGRFGLPLKHIYTISRQSVISILDDHGDIQTERSDEQLFAAVAQWHPEFQDTLDTLAEFRPFPGDRRSFDEPVFITARDAAGRLLDLAFQVRSAADLKENRT